MNDIDFYIYSMKEPDYVMKLMSTYGTNERVLDYQTQCIWLDERKSLVTKKNRYPEVISKHFKYRHAVDDHNANKHSPICLEFV